LFYNLSQCWFFPARRAEGSLRLFEFSCFAGFLVGGVWGMTVINPTIVNRVMNQAPGVASTRLGFPAARRVSLQLLLPTMVVGSVPNRELT
jgi:hypothetical protein